MTNPLNREAILAGDVYRRLKAQEHLTNIRPLTPDEQIARLDAFMKHHPGGPIWVFAYGSLLWNPAFHFAERRNARIWGYHRAFCLRTPLGRGTMENPGLVLGLDRGGSCTGVAFRLPAENERQELEVAWAREMAVDSYRAAWVRAHTPEGRVWALAFTMNRASPLYAGRLPEDRVAAQIATAEGYLGKCADYLDNTVAHLAECGIVDRRLIRLQRLVAAQR